MNNIKPIILLIPGIALILAIVLFISLLKKTSNRAVFKRFTFIALGLAFLLNFAWEVVQMPFYKGASFDIQHIAFCSLASVADAIMVLLLYFCFALIYKKPLWVQDLAFSRILILMFVGGIGAIGAELRHIASENWAYATSMPIIPVINVGLSPVLQFMLLPACIYYFSFKMKIKELTSTKPNY